MIWRFLAVFTVSIPIVVLIAELAARRWVRRQGYHVNPRWQRVHRYLDNRLVPGLPRVARFECNELGERGDPVPAGQPDLFRVLVAGGSSVECALLDQEDAWPAVTQRILNDPFSRLLLGAPRVHVGNIGRSLTPAGAVCRILERTLDHYPKLDLVVLMVGISDAIDWMELETPASMEGRDGDERLFGEHPEVAFSLLSRNWALRRVAAMLAMRSGWKITRKFDCVRRLEVLRGYRRAAVTMLDRFPDPEPMLSNLEQNLCRAIELAQRKGARVMVVRQPWFDKDRLSREEESAMWAFSRGRLSVSNRPSVYYTHAAVNRLLGRMDRRVAAVAERLGVAQLDLRPMLAASLGNYYDYVHFTTEGALAVGTHVANAILGVHLEQEPQPALAMMED